MILDKYNANVKITEAPPNHQIFFLFREVAGRWLDFRQGVCSKVLQQIPVYIPNQYRKITDKEVLSYAMLAKVIKTNLLSLKIQKNMQTSEELSPLHHKDTGGTFVYSSWAQVFLDIFLSLAKEYF